MKHPTLTAIELMAAADGFDATCTPVTIPNGSDPLRVVRVSLIPTELYLRVHVEITVRAAADELNPTISPRRLSLVTMQKDAKKAVIALAGRSTYQALLARSEELTGRLEALVADLPTDLWSDALLKVELDFHLDDVEIAVERYLIGGTR